MDTAALPPILAASTGLNHLAFRPDGVRVAVADTALGVEVREGERVVWSRTLAAAEPKVSSIQRIRDLAYSPDGGTLYVLDTDHLVALSGETGNLRWHYQPPRTLGFLVTSATALAVRGDGLVAAAFDNGAIGVWTPEGDLRGLWKDVDLQRGLAFLPDGRLLGDDSFGLSFFDVETRKRLFRVPLRDRSFGLAVGSNGRLVVRTLHEAWQLSSTGGMLARTPVAPGLPSSRAILPSPLIALGEAHAVLLVGMEGEVVRRIPVDETTVLALAFAPDGSLAVGGANGSLQTIDALAIAGTPSG